MNLSEVREVLAEAKRVQKDFVLPLSAIRVAAVEACTPDGHRYTAVKILTPDGREYGVNKVATQQLCSRLGVPSTYLPKCPVPLAQTNLDHWYNENKDERFLVRTNDETGTVRAVLSPKYTDVPHETILDAVRADGRLNQYEVRSFEVTDKQMELRLTHPQSFDIPTQVPGDAYYPGILIRNSDVGLYTFDVAAFLYILVCTNGMIGLKEVATAKRKHIGKFSVPSLIARGITNAVGNPQIAAMASLSRFAARELPMLSDDELLLSTLVGKGYSKKFATKVIGEVGTQVRSGWNVIQAITHKSQQLDADERQDADASAGDLALSLFRAYNPTAAERLVRLNGGAAA